MTKKNARIFWRIFVATMLVVAFVWHVTTPQPSTHPAAPAKPVQPEKPPVLVPPKLPALPKPSKEPAMSPPPVIIDMGIPALKPEKKVSILAMPEITPSKSKEKHVDPRIAAAAATSGDGFDRIVDGAVSLFVYVFTH